jgi:Flp pilus assembly protein TadG
MIATSTLARKRRDAGAGLLELAIVLVLLMLVTIGIVDFALGIRAYNALGYAAREGARYASVRSRQSRDPATADKIAARVLSQLVLMNESDVKVMATWTPSNTRGATVRVDVSYPYRTLTQVLPFQSIELTSSSEVIISE